MELLRPNDQPSYRSLRVAGARLHWCEIPGPSEARSVPLLLLHGLHDSHLTWKHIAPLFGRDRRVLMPDLFGCGLSDRPDASYALTWHAASIAQWLEAIGVTEVDVVGHSFGGGVGQMLLLEPKLKVRRLALLASGGLGRDVGVWLRLATLPVVERFGQPFMRHGTRYFLRSLNPSLRMEDLERMSAMNARAGSARAFARTVRDVIDWRGQRRMFYQRAHEITSLPPVMVCWGDRDEVIPIHHGVSFSQAAECVAFHRIEGAGHWLHHEQPQLVVDALRTFIDEPVVECMRLRPVPKTLIARTLHRVRGLTRKLRKPAPEEPVVIETCVVQQPEIAADVVVTSASAGNVTVLETAVQPRGLGFRRALARWMAWRPWRMRQAAYAPR